MHSARILITMRQFKTRPRGVTLIMVAGVLAILAALGTAFYTSAIVQSRSSGHYSDSVRAELLAKAGIADAAARLRMQTLERPESPSDPWYTVDWRNGAARNISFRQRNLTRSSNEHWLGYSRSLSNTAEINGDRYVLSVTDAQSKINLNACDNLAVVLDNLCRVIGSPLTCADYNYLQPRMWADLGAVGYNKNTKDQKTQRDLYFEVDGQNHPILGNDGLARYGDGYAIAGYRSRLPSGRFGSIDDVRDALTYTPNARYPDLEILQREIKFQALRDYITVDSWVDTATVSTGKFEWIDGLFAIDRDKSWVADDPKGDPLNHRGSLRGSYVSIMNGAGAGQMRKINTNGIDWIQLDQPFIVPPGPISSYMIVAKPDIKPDPYDTVNNTVAPDKYALKPAGSLDKDPDIDYSRYPLCIHRAPVNVNTASDKVLEALFLGVDVQHGTPMAVATQCNAQNTSNAWKTQDPHYLEVRVLTLTGCKRVPQDTGMPILDARMADLTKDVTFNYLNNYGTLSKNGTFVDGGGDISEAHELAYRVIMARQRSLDLTTGLVLADTQPDPDPTTYDPDTQFKGYERGPIRSWDDLYFRVIKPWDDIRSYGSPADSGRKTIPYSGNPGKSVSKQKTSVARMLMANFNPNTDILKFNPNIEWIDRWGRNFTEMEPIMIYSGNMPRYAAGDANHMWNYYYGNSNNNGRGGYYTRTFRYKSSEMIDKTDLNRSTTELCFSSFGVFDIDSRGEMVKDGVVLAERRVSATVKTYNVWRETTQLQFSRGKFDVAGGTGALGTNKSGRITRDNHNVFDRQPLNTLPEPLVPLGYKINPGKLNDLLDPSAPAGRDVWLAAKPAGMPDAVANRIFPATWDGQIVLATNMLDYTSDGCTFLASFNGDLDTDTCLGNGKELAKNPNDRRVRVVDTISLLGVLNDTEVDYDPTSTDNNGKKISQTTYNTFSTNDIAGEYFGPLNPQNYWENVLCRQGDLRAEGVWLGWPGVSGKDASLKYVYKNNYQIENGDGMTVFMWFKSNWTGSDHREHEFMNVNRVGDPWTRGVHNLVKFGRYSFANLTDGQVYNPWRSSDNCLAFATDGTIDSPGHRSDWNSYLHGGTWNVPDNGSRESPSFHVQPFRWGSVGGVFKWDTFVADNPSTEFSGWWENEGTRNNADRNQFITLANRPFIDSQRDPEGPNWSPQYFWKDAIVAELYGIDIGNKGSINSTVQQQAGWSWQDAASDETVFGINNLNKSQTERNIRVTPSDGTCAVIDEIKVCNKMWSTDRVYKEQTTCRYFTPDYPGDPSACPTFTSQSMLDSLYGPVTNRHDELIQVARVTWSSFNPRFNFENKARKGKRFEMIKQHSGIINFRGPFDYIQYNLDVLKATAAAEDRQNEGSANKPVMVQSVSVSPLGVERPSPVDYIKYGLKEGHASRGVEVALLKAGAVPVNGKWWESPEDLNAYDDPAQRAVLKASELYYRVRFRYHADPLVGIASGSGQFPDVDPTQHFVLDTPVFDDITVLYMTSDMPILNFKEQTE